MKFMQRAVAAGPSTSPSTPTSDDHEQSSKRRKTSGRSSLGGTPETQTYVIDHKAARAALEEEERKRQALVAKHAEALGDSHWVLDAAKLPAPQQGGAPLKIVQVGFSQIDRGGGAMAQEEDEEEEEEVATADGPTFRSFGPKKAAPAKDDNDDSDSDSDSDDSDSDSSGSSGEDSSEDRRKKSGRASHGSQKRPEIRSRRSVEWEKTQKLAKERRKKEVKLNTLTSISGSGPSTFGRSSTSGRRR